MGKIMRALYARLRTLSPETRQMIIGAGLAFDPLPAPRYQTFERSDLEALRKDWAAVGNDMWVAVGKAEHVRGQRSGH